MDKFFAINLMKRCGDGVITFIDRTIEPIMATIDFNVPYIRTKRNRRLPKGNNILVFSWTDDTFKVIQPKEIKSITPLSDILENVRD